MRKTANEGKVAPARADGENCPHCKHALSDAWIKTAHSRVAGRQGGRPRVLRPCPFCREKFGSRALREHVPRCPKVAKRSGDRNSIETGRKPILGEVAERNQKLA